MKRLIEERRNAYDVRYRFDPSSPILLNPRDRRQLLAQRAVDRTELSLNSNTNFHVSPLRYKKIDSLQITSTFRHLALSSNKVHAIELYRFITVPVSVYIVTCDVIQQVNFRVVDWMLSHVASQDAESKLTLEMPQDVYNMIKQVCCERDRVKCKEIKSRENDGGQNEVDGVDLFVVCKPFLIVVYHEGHDEVLARIDVHQPTKSVKKLKASLKASIPKVSMRWGKLLGNVKEVKKAAPTKKEKEKYPSSKVLGVTQEIEQSLGSSHQIRKDGTNQQDLEEVIESYQAHRHALSQAHCKQTTESSQQIKVNVTNQQKLKEPSKRSGEVKQSVESDQIKDDFFIQKYLEELIISGDQDDKEAMSRGYFEQTIEGLLLKNEATKLQQFEEHFANGHQVNGDATSQERHDQTFEGCQVNEEDIQGYLEESTKITNYDVATQEHNEELVKRSDNNDNMFEDYLEDLIVIESSPVDDVETYDDIVIPGSQLTPKVKECTKDVVAQLRGKIERDYGMELGQDDDLQQERHVIVKLLRHDHKNNDCDSLPDEVRDSLVYFDSLLGSDDGNVADKNHEEMLTNFKENGQGKQSVDVQVKECHFEESELQKTLMTNDKLSSDEVNAFIEAAKEVDSYKKKVAVQLERCSQLEANQSFDFESKGTPAEDVKTKNEVNQELITSNRLKETLRTGSLTSTSTVSIDSAYWHRSVKDHARDFDMRVAKLKEESSGPSNCKRHRHIDVTDSPILSWQRFKPRPPPASKMPAKGVVVNERTASVKDTLLKFDSLTMANRYY